MEEENFEGDSGYVEGDAESTLRPLKFEHDHISKLQVFSEDLQSAIKTSFPRAVHPYTSVTILLLKWADDDLNIQIELDRLRDVFERQFRFATEQWNIPSPNPTRALQAKLYEFQDAHQSSSELLIVYYGGHGRACSRGKSVWAAYNRPGSPTLTWSSLQHLLENAVPHVLIILDCCFAANAARDTAEGTTKEILAACGRETPTTGVGFRSFTSALIEELHMFGNMPFTVTMLHSRLVTLRWRLQFTPFYALLSEHGGKSIHLGPLPLPAIHDSVAELPSNGECTTNSEPTDPSSSDESLFTESPQQSSQSSLDTRSDTRVLLAVSIQHEAVHDVSEWVSWLTSEAPWDVTKIEVQVEGVYKSHSTLLLVSIPIYAWDSLPDRGAYNFVAFIKSGNLRNPTRSQQISEKHVPNGASQEHKSSRQSVIDLHMQKSGIISLEVEAEKATRRTVSEPADKANNHLSRGSSASRSTQRRYDELSTMSGGDGSQGPPAHNTRRRQRNDVVEDLPALSKPSKTIAQQLVALDNPEIIQLTAQNSDELESNQLNHRSRVSSKFTMPNTTRVRSRRSNPYPPIAPPTTTAFPTPPPTSGNWSIEDDAQLQQARRQGMNWQPIATQYFPTKTANACRKRHERLMERAQADKAAVPDQSEVNSLAKIYCEMREEVWKVMASRLGEDWKTVEAKCMGKGLKTLKSMGNRVDEAIDIIDPNDSEESDSGFFSAADAGDHGPRSVGGTHMVSEGLMQDRVPVSFPDPKSMEF